MNFFPVLMVCQPDIRLLNRHFSSLLMKQALSFSRSRTSKPALPCSLASVMIILFTILTQRHEDAGWLRVRLCR
ncbi:MAG: hypothetical protein COT06_04035 [Syntrophobacteraceae bacterium CG07_land_8_20_14_0_80_61_8]|nr:MAG: hypothetical protein COT06_04035 [Syntrophobacteraceae bacterium CG07_land_8_20_14_0_80_61_8]